MAGPRISGSPAPGSKDKQNVFLTRWTVPNPQSLSLFFFCFFCGYLCLTGLQVAVWEQVPDAFQFLTHYISERLKDRKQTREHLSPSRHSGNICFFCWRTYASVAVEPGKGKQIEGDKSDKYAKLRKWWGHFFLYQFSNVTVHFLHMKALFVFCCCFFKGLKNNSVSGRNKKSSHFFNQTLILKLWGHKRSIFLSVIRLFFLDIKPSAGLTARWFMSASAASAGSDVGLF